MPRDLFGDVQQPVTRVGSRSRYTVVLSLAAHAAAVAAIVAATVLGPVVLPGLASSDLTYVTAMLPKAPPPPLPPRGPKPAEAPPPLANPNAAPIDVPDGIAPEPDVPFDVGAGPDVGLDTVFGVTGLDTLLGEPPPTPPALPPGPVRVGVHIRPPSKIRDASPVYPVIAQTAGVQGLVILEALIGSDGRVQSAQVLRGHPLLNDAALTAVRQWEYTPTLLNGVPVPVVMSVTVNFALR